MSVNDRQTASIRMDNSLNELLGGGTPPAGNIP